MSDNEALEDVDVWPDVRADTSPQAEAPEQKGAPAAGGHRVGAWFGGWGTRLHKRGVAPDSAAGQDEGEGVEVEKPPPQATPGKGIADKDAHGDGAAEGGGVGLGQRIGGLFTATVRSVGGVTQKTLSTIMAGGRPKNVREAISRLDHAAAGMTAATRAGMLRGWIQSLQEPAAGSVTMAPAAGDDDWQELNTSAQPPAGGRVPAAPASPRSMRFREIFLASKALEATVESFLLTPPADEEESELLHTVLVTCLLAEPTRVDALQARLADLGAAAARGSAFHVLGRQTVLNMACVSVGGLKAHGDVEALGERIAELRAQYAALEADEGADGRAKRMWQLTEQLCELETLRMAVLQRQEPVEYADYLKSLARTDASLKNGIETVASGREANEEKMELSKQHRAGRMTEMSGRLRALNEEIRGLEDERATLMAQLAALEGKLGGATMRRAELEEERNVFEEGSALTLEVIQQEAEQLVSRGADHEVELEAVGVASSLIRDAMEMQMAAWCTSVNTFSATQAEAKDSLRRSMATYTQAQNEALSLRLAQLRFCAGELRSIRAKQVEMETIGLHFEAESLLSSAKGLTDKYLAARAQAKLIVAEYDAAVTATHAHLGDDLGGELVAARDGMKAQRDAFLETFMKLPAWMAFVAKEEEEQEGVSNTTASGTDAAADATHDADAAQPIGTHAAHPKVAGSMEASMVTVEASAAGTMEASMVAVESSGEVVDPPEAAVESSGVVVESPHAPVESVSGGGMEESSSNPFEACGTQSESNPFESSSNPLQECTEMGSNPFDECAESGSNPFEGPAKSGSDPFEGQAEASAPEARPPAGAPKVAGDREQSGENPPDEAEVAQD